MRMDQKQIRASFIGLPILKKRLGSFWAAFRRDQGYDWQIATDLAVAKVMKSKEWEAFVHERIEADKGSLVSKDERPIACRTKSGLHADVAK